MIMTVDWSMATKSLNVRALAVWAVAPLAVAGAVWLIDRAGLWGLGLLAIWVGLGVVAPLPWLRHALRSGPARRRPAVKPATVKPGGRPSGSAPSPTSRVARSIWAGPVMRESVVVDRRQPEQWMADEERELHAGERPGAPAT